MEFGQRCFEQGFKNHPIGYVTVFWPSDTITSRYARRKNRMYIGWFALHNGSFSIHRPIHGCAGDLCT